MELDEAPLDLVTLDDIQAAAEVLRAITIRTPLLPFGAVEPLDEHGRPRAWLKPETLQPIGAFKLRGAYNALWNLSGEERQRGVVTHSSGNHAQGVARAARLLGIRAIVVMPSDAPRIKVERVRADGAEIVFVGASADERAERAQAIAGEQAMVLIPSYDDRRIVAGQGTVGLEIAQEIGRGDTPIAPPGMPFTVLVPIGGGGLAAGIATAIKSLRPDARVFGVEPELAADAQQSLQEGRIVRWSPELTARTVADGVRTTSVGRVTFPHLQAYLDGILTVSEIEIARAMARLARDARLIVEPSGAVSFAAWLFHAGELPVDGPVVSVLSGGNVDPDTFADLMARGEAAGG
ncbi:MAG: threo-3-hydroxy-L-aspartate ammonia-lyase [Chloroflexota bacterium]|nr:threo-3-hydroxy-L-aspartate ammonia-lyase [Chloroflexota bacterium]